VAIAEALLVYEVLDDLEINEIIETGKLVRKAPRKKKRKSVKKEKSTDTTEGKKDGEPEIQAGLFPPSPAENPAPL